MILTNDPSFSSGWGWAVMDGMNIVKCDAFKILPIKKKRVLNSDFIRFNKLTETLLKIIKDNNITEIVSEAPHGSKSARAAKLSGAIMSTLITISICLNIPLKLIYQGDIKKHIFNKQKVDKTETQEFIEKVFNLPEIKTNWKYEAICDALAVYYYTIK